MKRKPSTIHFFHYVKHVLLAVSPSDVCGVQFIKKETHIGIYMA